MRKGKKKKKNTKEKINKSVVTKSALQTALPQWVERYFLDIIEEHDHLLPCPWSR